MFFAVWMVNAESHAAPGGVTTPSPLEQRLASSFTTAPAPNTATPADALRLFAEVPAAAFVFAAREINASCPDARSHVTCHRDIPKGEALLVLGVYKEKGIVVLLTVDGQVWTVGGDQLTTYSPKGARVLSLVEADLVIRKSGGGNLEVVTEGTGKIDLRPDFLDLLPDGDKRRETFVADQTAVNACYDKVMSQLDPNARRNDYDIAKGDRVESLANHLDDKAAAKCGGAAFTKRRLKLQSEVLAPARKALLAGLSPVMERVNALLKDGSTATPSDPAIHWQPAAQSRVRPLN